jgi:hypothetical protein
VDAALTSSLVTGGGVAGVFCILFITSQIFPRSVVEDKNKIIAEKDLKIDALTSQVAASTAALMAAKDVISSLQQGLIASGRMPSPPYGVHGPPALPGGLPGEAPS